MRSGGGGQHRHGLRVHCIAFWLENGSLAWFLPIIAAAIIGATTGGAAWWTVIPLGLLQRGTAVTEMAAIVMLALISSRPLALSPGSAIA